MIGKLLDYRYKVIRVLATGGFGETYIAEDTKRPGNPICVVKHLLPASSDLKIFDTAKRLFQSEAETLEKLGNHDQIPRLLAYFVENHEFYLVQEFIEGHTLSEELVSEEVWNESQVIQLLYEVLTVLEFVHQQGVIHRDIKPDNIIRRRGNNKLVLVDFGAVKQLRASGNYPSRTILAQSATVAIGTPGYMPTEQGQGKPRPNSDIYALGIIAVQALTGITPMDLQEDHNTGEILWQDLVSVSPQLAAVLNKMIRYHFKERYQSASEALQALQVFAPLPTSVREHSSISIYSDVSYPIVKVGSPQSRQKTLAVAPANQDIQHAAPTKPVRKDAAGFDFLQLLILVLLAGGAAYVAPMVVKNAQGLATNWTKGNTLAAQTCTAVTNQTANIRSEPSSLDTATIIETVSDRTPLDVTGTRTKRGWIQVRLDLNKVAWVHSDVVGNKEEWVSCLRDKSVAIKTINDSTVVAVRPAPKPKPKSLVDWLPFPNNNKAKNKDKNKDFNQIEPVPTQEAKPQEQVVEQAREKYDSGDLQGAIALLKSIPAGIEETTKTISQWQQDWSKAEALFTDINDAVAQGKWDKVQSYKNNPDKLPNIQYWRDKIEPMLKDAADNLAKQQIPQTGRPQRTERKINSKPEVKQDNPEQENPQQDNPLEENPQQDNPTQENSKQDNNFLNPEKLFNFTKPQ